MKNDVSPRESDRYGDSASGGENREFIVDGSANGVLGSRRDFLKHSGGATAATMLALHGMKVESLANAVYSGVKYVKVEVNSIANADDQPDNTIPLIAATWNAEPYVKNRTEAEGAQLAIKAWVFKAAPPSTGAFPSTTAKVASHTEVNSAVWLVVGAMAKRPAHAVTEPLWTSAGSNPEKFATALAIKIYEESGILKVEPAGVPGGGANGFGISSGLQENGNGAPENPGLGALIVRHGENTASLTIMIIADAAWSFNQVIFPGELNFVIPTTWNAQSGYKYVSGGNKISGYGDFTQQQLESQNLLPEICWFNQNGAPNELATGIGNDHYRPIHGYKKQPLALKLHFKAVP